MVRLNQAIRMGETTSTNAFPRTKVLVGVEMDAVDPACGRHTPRIKEMTAQTVTNFTIGRGEALTPFGSAQELGRDSTLRRT
jgi:hypothetical protein